MKRTPRAVGMEKAAQAKRPIRRDVDTNASRRGPAKVRRRDAAATRGRILEAAMEAFANKGLDASIEDIAMAAGANRRMAYFYFESKEGLYLAALEATFFELAQVERSIDVEELGPFEAIAALVSAKFEHYAEHPRYVEFLKIENLHKARHMKNSERLKDLRSYLLTLVKRALDRGQALGIMRSDVDPLELYIAICAMGFFAFSNQFTLNASFNIDVTAPAVLERRRRMIIDMVAAYLGTGIKSGESAAKHGRGQARPTIKGSKSRA